jgi:hypothetical protein
MICVAGFVQQKCIASRLLELLPSCSVHMITPDIVEVPSRNKLTGVQADEDK